jgi:hypothetical protein
MLKSNSAALLVVGVPLIVPLEATCKPKAQLVALGIVKVYGGVPPEAVKRAKYGLLMKASGRELGPSVIFTPLTVN